MPSENGDSVEIKLGNNEKGPEHELKLNELEALGIAVCTAFKSNKEVFHKIRSNSFDLQLEQSAVENWLKRYVYGAFSAYVSACLCIKSLF